MRWDDAVAFALTLPDAVHATHYAQPAVKVNGHAVLNVGNEAATSFVLHLDRDLVDMLVAAHPATFWQSPHYQGYAAVLVRYDTPDDPLVREMIARGCEQAGAKKPPRPRKR